MLNNLGIFKDFSDGSLKGVFDVGDKKIIEMTLLFNKEDMDVVCAPTHHFCNLGCKMCHLTNKGLNKQMNAIKSDDFIEALIRTVTIESEDGVLRRTDKRKLLISFMGVGEPLLNLKLIEEIYKKEDYLKERLGYSDIGYALATMMPNDNILKLIDMVKKLNIPLKVHFSMHSPLDEARLSLIPSTKVGIEEALAYLLLYRKELEGNAVVTDKYTKFHRTSDPVEIHYTLINGVNDKEEELTTICRLLKKYQIPIKFIEFNPINDLARSTNQQLWLDTIREIVPGLRVKLYNPPGHEIGSSCGEFTKHYYHEEIETKEQREEFEAWRVKHLVK